MKSQMVSVKNDQSVAAKFVGFNNYETSKKLTWVSISDKI